MKQVICINKEVSQRVSQISYPKIREIFDRARTYDNVISLGIGEPDFDTDRNIISQAFQSVVKKKLLIILQLQDILSFGRLLPLNIEKKMD